MKRFLFINESGFTYIEVIIAMTILAVFSLPLLQGFYQTARENAYAKENYKGTLFCKNLVEESIYALNVAFDENKHILEESQYLYEFLGYTEENFLKLYEAGHFNFYIQITNGEEDYFFYYGEKDPPERFYNTAHTMRDTQFANEFVYDAKIKCMAQNFVTLQNNVALTIENDFDTCRITGDESLSKNIFVHIDVNGEMYDETYLQIRNDSAYAAYFIVEGENAAKPIITYGGGPIFVMRRQTKGGLKNYTLNVAVTNQKNQMVKQITTVYSYDYARPL